MGDFTDFAYYLKNTLKLFRDFQILSVENQDLHIKLKINYIDYILLKEYYLPAVYFL